MIKTETITAKIKNRILVTDAPIFSGETVKIRLAIDAADAVASNHKLVLFGVDKTALAEGTFSATENAWIAELNTATQEMAAYFEGVPVDATKTIGAMVVNTQTADVITRGNVLVVSTPFPENLSPCPQTYSYLTTDEFSSTVADLESEIGGKASASDFIQLSSTVADLSADVEGKADASEVADLASQIEDWGEVITDLSAELSGKADQSAVEELAQIISDVDSTKADSSTVSTLADDVSSLSADMTTLSADVVSMSSSIDNKAEASDLSDLALEVDFIGQGLAYKAESSDVADLAAEVASKADSSTVAALSSSTLQTSQLVTSITAQSTDNQIPTAKSVKAFVESQSGGGFLGFTVTFANDYSMKGMAKPSAAPFFFIQADGTKVEIDCKDSTLRGRIIRNVVLIQSGLWVGNFYDLDFSSSGVYAWSDNSMRRGLWLTVGGVVYGIMPFAAVSGTSTYLPFNNGQATPYNQLFLPGDATITHSNAGIPCLLKGTLITLANGKAKPIEKISYADDLLVWDFDNGCLASAKPLWIKRPQIAPYYFRNILGDGRELLTTGKSKTGWGHRMFDLDKGAFRYTTETVADRIYTLDGIELHKSCERIVEECEYYNIITERHFNLFANGILTSCSLNNLYCIDGMKFKKAKREPRPFDAYKVPLKYFTGLRLAEQSGEVDELNEYVARLVSLEV